ncbi:MAG: tryptophan 2,3-dioxygenase [Janthinobacterium lividum]
MIDPIARPAAQFADSPGCPLGYGNGANRAAPSVATEPAAIAQEKNWHDAQLDFSGSMSYGDYLGLDQILTAQHPRSPDHNEMLFIIQHQTTELWMRLILVELNGALEGVRQDRLDVSFKMLARVSRIFEQMVQAWGILATLTPSEYTAMRPHLEASSGFQSYQYRQLEFILGNKNAKLLEPHAHRADLHTATEKVLLSPSFYDEVVFLLARRGMTIDPERLQRDWTLPTQANDSVERAWQEVYSDPSAHWDLYQMAEKLIDVEDVFRQWRFRHVTTVERIIGAKPGTGGTNGATYLRKMLDTVLFPELWSVRTLL